MKLIPLTQGQFAMVDDEDYDFLMQFKWQAVKGRKTFYARRTQMIATVMRTYYMHRILMKANKNDPFIDHKDENGLNNQKDNLRFATNSQNAKNKGSEQNSSSPYKGVSKMTLKKGNLTYWHAQISVNGKNKHLGTFPFTPEGEIAAAKCFDKASRLYDGEFAYQNFPKKRTNIT